MEVLEAQQLARKFIAGLDLSNIQNDLSVYLEKAGARLKKEELEEGESGYTVTLKGKHVITVNSREPEERQRFTICHEIAHLTLGLASSHQEVPSWSYAKRDVNEVLCDVFATELLMPYALFIQKMPADEPTAELIKKLGEDFGASFPAAASRYATLADFPCAYITMDKGVVRYAVMSTSLRNKRARISIKSPIPEGSLAHTLRTDGLVQTKTEEVAQDAWFEDWESGLDLWEICRHYPRFDTTLSLIWFNEEDLPVIEVDRFGKQVVEDERLSELTGELQWKKRTRRK